MTDRIHSLTVALDKDYRADDVQAIVNAIKMVKGVLNVGLNVTDHNDYTARMRARMELQDQIRDILWPKS
jgi:hypothetical protein